MKKIIATLSLIIFLLLPTQVSANTNLDQMLLNRGIPQELIELMPNTQKQDIIDNNLIFKSYENEEIEINDSNHTSSISARNTISDNTLSLTCSCYYEPNYSSSNKQITFYVNYDWSKVPQMTLTDAYGIAWGDNWKAVPNSHKSYTYWKLAMNQGIKSNTETALAYANSYGAGWNTDIKYSYGLQYVVDNYGYGKITLEAKKPSKTGSDQVCINYTHRKSINGTFGLSLGPCSVSYSGTADADTKGIYFNFNY